MCRTRQDENADASSWASLRNWLPAVVCLSAVMLTLAIGVMLMLALAVWSANRDVLFQTETRWGGHAVSLWMQAEGDEVWVCAQHDPGSPNGGTYSTAVFAAANARAAAKYVGFPLPVVARGNWTQADIRIDEHEGTARFTLERAVIQLDLKSLDFGDPYEVSVEASLPTHGR